jgi:hypothetical protein
MINIPYIQEHPECWSILNFLENTGASEFLMLKVRCGTVRYGTVGDGGGILG